MDEDPAGRSGEPGGREDPNPGGDDGGWFFDLPEGAWQRQEEKNRGLRRSVRSNLEAHRRDRRLVRPADADLLPPPEKRRFFGRKRKSAVEAWESPGGTFQLRKETGGGRDRSPDDDSDDWSTEGELFPKSAEIAAAGAGADGEAEAGEASGAFEAPRPGDAEPSWGAMPAPATFEEEDGGGAFAAWATAGPDGQVGGQPPVSDWDSPGEPAIGERAGDADDRAGAPRRRFGDEDDRVEDGRFAARFAGADEGRFGGRFDFQDGETDILSGMRAWSSGKRGGPEPDAPQPAARAPEERGEQEEAAPPTRFERFGADAPPPVARQRKGLFARLFGRGGAQPAPARMDPGRMDPEEAIFAEWTAEPPQRAAAHEREAATGWRAGWGEQVEELAAPGGPARPEGTEPGALRVEAIGEAGVLEPVEVLFEGSLEDEVWAPEPYEVPAHEAPVARETTGVITAGSMPAAWTEEPTESPEPADAALPGGGEPAAVEDGWSAWLEGTASQEAAANEAAAKVEQGHVEQGAIEPASLAAEAPASGAPASSSGWDDWELDGAAEDERGLEAEVPVAGSEPAWALAAQDGWATEPEPVAAPEAPAAAMESSAAWAAREPGPGAAPEAPAAAMESSAAWAAREPGPGAAPEAPAAAMESSAAWAAWELGAVDGPAAQTAAPVGDAELEVTGAAGESPWDGPDADRGVLRWAADEAEAAASLPVGGQGEEPEDDARAFAGWERPEEEPAGSVIPGDDAEAEDSTSVWSLEGLVEEGEGWPEEASVAASAREPAGAGDGPDVLGYLDEILPDGEPPPPPPMGGVARPGRRSAGWLEEAPADEAETEYEDVADFEAGPMVAGTAEDEMDLVLRAFEAHAASELPEEPQDLAPIRQLLGDEGAELVAEDEDEQEPAPFVPAGAWAPQRGSGSTEAGAGAWDSHAHSGAALAPDEGLGGWAPVDREEGGGEPPWDDRPLATAGAASGSHRQARTVVREIVETGLLALLVFLAVRASFQNFKVDGDSMFPTLHDGEFLIVNKIVYSEVDKEKLGRFVPFVSAGENPKSNLFHGPQRGEIIVFRDPRNPEVDLIKRIIGLPGETVEIINGKVYINDHLLEEPYIKTQWHDTKPRVQIGPDEYFVMGDNRNNSLDSRAIGLVHRDLIIGKAMLTYWPKSKFGLAPNQTPTLSETELRPGLAAVPAAEGAQ
jgi:signal peptidase I